MRFRVLAAVSLALMLVLASPAAVSASHNVTKIHTTDGDFNAGTFNGNVSVDGSGKSATLVMGTDDSTTQTFSYTGSSQTFQVPNGVDNITAELWGAGGGKADTDVENAGLLRRNTSDGQSGGFVKVNFAVSSGQTLYLYVGGDGANGSADLSSDTATGGSGGFNGGGDGGAAIENGNANADTAAAAGGGGGATGMRLGGDQLVDRVAVAAGGAGGNAIILNEGTSDSIDLGTSGQGGADTGEDGNDAATNDNTASGGAGGDQTSEGATGENGNSDSIENNFRSLSAASGGGGGGFDFGRAGQVDIDNAPSGAVAGSGGGSNYVDSNVAISTHSNTRGSGNAENGQITLTYNVPVSTYISANYTVENPQSGFVDVSSNSDANLTVIWEGWTGSSWTTLNKTTSITTAGNVSYTFASASVTKVRVNLTTKTVSGADSSTLRVADEGVAFQTHDATVDNASADPQGGTLIKSSPVTLSIDVNDTDFGKSHGDSVDVQFFVNETGDDSPRSIGTDTLISNRTASVSYSPQKGGNVTWYVWANDSYGHSQKSDSFNLTTPSELSIYSETNGSKLLKNANITLQFYINESQDNATILTRNTSDGTINMAGLPVDEPFVVVAEADGYRQRRVYIRNLFTQQRVYLLNNSVTAVETIFALEDYTGDFPDEPTVLIVQNAINGSYETVLGDFFGGTGQFSAKLQEQERHRLILLNTVSGEERQVGTFTPITSSRQTIVVTPEGVKRLSSQGTTVRVSPQTRRLPAQDNVNVSVTVTSPEDVSWTVTADIVNNSGRFEVWNYSASSAGDRENRFNLTNRQNATLNVTVSYSVDGSTVTKHYVYSIGATFADRASLLEAVGSLAQLAPQGARDAFTGFMAMLLTVLVVGSVGTRAIAGEVAGLVGVFVMLAFALIGWTSYDVVFAAAVGLLSFAAIRRGL